MLKGKAAIPGDAISIDAITASPVEAAPQTADAQTDLEKIDLEYAHKLAELEDYKQDIESRRAYAKNIFTFMCCWIAGIYLLLVFQGFSYIGFHLSDSVLLAAIGSTTANVIGIFIMVTRYFFSKKH
jgi:hypothetical protein